MDDPYLLYKEKICINCINSQCNKQFTIIENENTKTIKCLGYIKNNNITPYIEPIERTAEQLKPIMRFL